MTAYLIGMFGTSLALTLMIELVVALFWGVYSLRGIVLVVLVNILTNPFVVLVYWLSGMYLPVLPAILVQLVLEMAAVMVEAGIYCSFAREPEWKIRRPVLLSVTANLCAWLFGFVRVIL